MKDKILDIVLPPIEKLSIFYILIQLFIGIILKYLLGGTVLDLIGHLVIFLSAINIKNLAEKYLKRDLNTVFSIIIIGGSFILMQMLGIVLVDNTFGMKPILSTQKNKGTTERAYLVTFPNSKGSSSEIQSPADIVNVVLAKFKGENSNLTCAIKEGSTKYEITDKDGYRDLSKSLDLNGDGTEELLVLPIEVCGNVIRGASGNGPLYVFQKKDTSWVIVGELVGNQLKITNRKMGNYYNIETNYHMSACSGITYLYSYGITESDESTGIYQQVSENEYNHCETNKN